MKIEIIISALFIFLGTNLLFGQSKKNDPENIIITYNKDGTKTITYKDELSHNPDSLNHIFLSEVQDSYKLKKNSSYIKSKVIGKWYFKNAVRTNSVETSISSPDFYEFYKNGYFIQVNSSDTSKGKWTISDKASVRLDFDKPFMAIKDTNILKYLDSASLKNLTFNNIVITLNKLDKQKMTLLSSIIASNDQETNDIHYRIVFLNYSRK
ncbi:hypothetical protein L0U88_20495 [Flavihumibacter sp. RY-1]|uniref:Uncharacterized protein n=1 Tax=Flavihumibacter fluminis TaxID=2909236 RepID=A0ABS9BP87_9BACT|nr:hypothetical protein [Flavihumibacter fluminis]MCF1717034.1 hypothetical protein [Flavihumibacter fluminis]